MEQSEKLSRKAASIESDALTVKPALWAESMRHG
jgi:hypothetical protein